MDGGERLCVAELFGRAEVVSFTCLNQRWGFPYLRSALEES